MVNECGKNDIKGYYTAEQLSLDVAGIIYRQGKAQIFNVLESQFQDQVDLRLKAVKRLTENILANIGKDVSKYISDVLGDWKQEVLVSAEDTLTDQELEEAKKEHEEQKKLFRY